MHRGATTGTGANAGEAGIAAQADARGTQPPLGGGEPRAQEHLGELERRVAGLSKRNAQLQVEQIRAVRAHVQAEGLKEEIATLERERFETEMLAARTQHDLELWG